MISDAERAAIRAEAKAIAAMMPPLTPDQRDQLYLLLAPIRRDAKGRRITPTSIPREEPTNHATRHAAASTKSRP